MLTSEDKKKVALDLIQQGMPLGFDGDRFDAFKLGLDACLRRVSEYVTIDSTLDETVRVRVREQLQKAAKENVSKITKLAGKGVGKKDAKT